jgi:DNA polymerase-3 subunit alpha
VKLLCNNYACYHLHSDFSNCTTNIDSVTKYSDYVERAKSLGMTALGFSEHGNVYGWWRKKCTVEAAGMKYIHACEFYLTETLEEKVRDNYHCVLLARNEQGFLELNRLVSRAHNRLDNHFYYVPRISFDELFATSDNIFVTTACVGGVLCKGSEQAQEKMLHFLACERHRCFLEVGHHMDPRQVDYNRKLLALHEQTEVPLIVGTDTHALDEQHLAGRKILQLAKRIHFADEDSWDLQFRSYDELCGAFRAQGALPEDTFLQAIEASNLLADMIEPFEIDRNLKYPKLCENPVQILREQVSVARAAHPYANQRHAPEVLDRVIEEELAVCEAAQSAEYMLLEKHLVDWEHTNGVRRGYGRGSVNGSMIAYLLGITEMDSLHFGLNFFRFMSPSRVSNADIDADYGSTDRDKVKEYLLRDHMGLPQIQSAEIVTFNTIQTKKAIREVGRALEIPLPKVSEIVAAYDEYPASLEAQDAHFVRMVHAVIDTIESVGTHASGVLLSDLPIAETIGLTMISSNEFPVSSLDMKELDDLFYVKLDILGLDNIAVVNQTCDLLGIARLTPDNVDLEDEAVWQSIRDDTTLIFQWESQSARAFIKRLLSESTVEKFKSRAKDFSMIKLLSLGNGLIRPACASFREEVARGEFYDNGFPALNEFLSQESGRIVMQETIMRWLVEFCGYSPPESDNVRRAIAKKKGTETLLPEIRRRFVDYAPAHYDISPEQCEKVIDSFLQIILDASAYAFSWNHSDPYSATGYICGWLRHYHPLEFLTTALNVFDKPEKQGEIIAYAGKIGIRVTPPKFGVSQSGYAFDPEQRVIAKGLASMKHMGAAVAGEVYALSQRGHWDCFCDLLRDLYHETHINSRQIDSLIKVDFFADFGNQRELLRIVDLFEQLKRGEAKQIKREQIDGGPFEEAIRRCATWQTKNGGESKSYTFTDLSGFLRACETIILGSGLQEFSLAARVQNFAEIMGYLGYVTGKEADRRTLYIKEVRPLHRKSDGKHFGYSVATQSIGSGKEGQFTVRSALFERVPLHPGDVVHCLGWERRGQYFHMTNYSKGDANGV